MPKTLGDLYTSNLYAWDSLKMRALSPTARLQPPSLVNPYISMVVGVKSTARDAVQAPGGSHV